MARLSEQEYEKRKQMGYWFDEAVNSLFERADTQTEEQFASMVGEKLAANDGALRAVVTEIANAMKAKFEVSQFISKSMATAREMAFGKPTRAAGAGRTSDTLTNNGVLALAEAIANSKTGGYITWRQAQAALVTAGVGLSLINSRRKFTERFVGVAVDGKTVYWAGDDGDLLMMRDAAGDQDGQSQDSQA